MKPTPPTPRIIDLNVNAHELVQNVVLFRTARLNPMGTRTPLTLDFRVPEQRLTRPASTLVPRPTRLPAEWM